jgi:hypothetical protein
VKRGLSLAFLREGGLEVFGVNARFGALHTGHRRSLRSKHPEEPSPGRESSESEETSTLSDVPTSRFRPHLRLFWLRGFGPISSPVELPGAASILMLGRNRMSVLLDLAEGVRSFSAC